MTFETFFKNVLNRVKIEVAEEFDKNFERKGFFEDKWPDAKKPNAKGSLMMRSGALRRGNQSRIEGENIVFTNSKPYAQIHNEGGTITVTAKMKKFFWAMYYQAANKVIYSVKDKAARKTKKNDQLSLEANYWKSLALMKVGEKIKIPKRQWIGWHPRVEEIIKKHFDEQMRGIEQQVTKMLTPKF